MSYIFIHGLGQTASSWEETISGLDQSIQVDCPDLPGLVVGEEVTYANLYWAFVEYCEGFLAPINLCGLSLGGILALQYTIEYPQKVESLVLIGAQVTMPKTLLKIQNVLFRFMPESTFAGMGLQKKDIIRLTNSMVDIDFSGRLKDITCPTLILCGVKDTANKKAAQSLAQNIPGAKWKMVEGAGHEVNKDKPEELGAELEQFYH